MLIFNMVVCSYLLFDSLHKKKIKTKTKTSCYYISLLILLRNKFNGISKCDILSENHNKDKKKKTKIWAA